MPVSRIYTACIFFYSCLFIVLCINTIIIVGSWISIANNNKNYSDLIDNNNLNGGNSVCFHSGCIILLCMVSYWNYDEAGIRLCRVWAWLFHGNSRSAVVCLLNSPWTDSCQPLALSVLHTAFISRDSRAIVVSNWGGSIQCKTH